MKTSAFAGKLSAPVSMAIQGKPFRETVQQLAEKAKVNVWIDRGVDPSATVEPDQLGPTAYAALRAVAAERDCVIMPVANVVLIGRPAWVDATAASLIPIGTQTPSGTIVWGTLTTPTEAFALTLGEDSSAAASKLPHDLWPETKLSVVRRAVAANLVLAQFGRKLHNTDSLSSIAIVPMGAPDELVTRTYSSIATLESDFRKFDPKEKLKKASFKKDGTLTAVTATARAHRLATEAMMLVQQPAKAAANGIENDTRTFSLKLVNTPAQQALQQFAQAAGIQCVIDPSATEAVRKVISLEAKDATLKTLIENVAKAAGTTAEWKPGVVVISVKAAE